MRLMRIRAAGVVALWVIVVMATSAVLTCIPGVMAPQSTETLSCMGDMGNAQAAVSSSNGPMGCCTQHESQIAVTKKVDVLTAPVRAVLHWLTPITPVTVVWVPSSIVATGSPPDPTVALGPPRYISFGTLLI